MWHESNYRYLLSRLESDNGVSVVQAQRPAIGNHTFRGQYTFSMKAVSLRIQSIMSGNAPARNFHRSLYTFDYCIMCVNLLRSTECHIVVGKEHMLRQCNSERLFANGQLSSYT